MNKKLENSQLNRLKISEFKQAKKFPIIIILDSIRSLNNIGSVFRTCDAFLIKKIYLCGITAIPPHNDIRKTALGSTLSVDWEYVEDVLSLIKKLKNLNIITISIEQVEKSIMLDDFEPFQDTTYAFVFGNEVKGVKQDVVNASDFAVEIPQFGTKHSLNIAMSCGIVIWDMYSKLNRAKLSGIS